MAQALTAFSPLEEDVVRCYTAQVVSGLCFLHHHGIIHRDVKGSNLLLTTEGRVKLGDLGSSKAFDLASTSFSMSQSGSSLGQELTRSFKGSAYWIAPEVIRRGGPSLKNSASEGRGADVNAAAAAVEEEDEGYSFSCDIWSLGISILEMLLGHPPFTRDTEGPFQALMLIATATEKELACRLKPPEGLSALGCDFLRQCLRVDPSKRPAAAALMKQPCWYHVL